jgi:hypothetical protein
MGLSTRRLYLRVIVITSGIYIRLGFILILHLDYLAYLNMYIMNGAMVRFPRSVIHGMEAP